MNKETPKPGPNPERLSIDEDDWEGAVGKALKKQRPKDGWPKGRAEEKPDDA